MIFFLVFVTFYTQTTEYDQQRNTRTIRLEKENSIGKKTGKKKRKTKEKEKKQIYRYNLLTNDDSY